MELTQSTRPHKAWVGTRQGRLNATLFLQSSVEEKRDSPQARKGESKSKASHYSRQGTSREGAGIAMRAVVSPRDWTFPCLIEGRSAVYPWVHT